MKKRILLPTDNTTGTLLFSSIFESCYDAIDFKTPDGIIAAWNPAAEKLYGFTAKEMIGKHIKSLYLPNTYTQFAKRFELTKKTLRPFHFESTRLTRQGVAIDVFMTLSPVVDPTGHLLGVSAISRDISKEKQLIAETEKLTQDREELLSIIGNDVLNSIHQLNRIITVLDRNPNCAEISLPRQIFELLLKSNNDFARSIENLLMVYSVGNENNLTFRKLNIVEFIKSQIECYNKEIISKKINLVFHHELEKETDRVINADERMLKRLFRNTLDWAASNCVDKSVFLKASKVRNGSKLKITIDFHGKTYDDSQINSLFSSRWREINGAETGSISGLGLFLARCIAQSHGGSLTLSSFEKQNRFELFLANSKNPSNKRVELIRQ